MNKALERYLAFGFGVVFIVVLLVLAIKFPTPTPFQYTVFRIILALAAGGVAGMIPGFLQVKVSKWVRAGGALAVFVIVYFYSPAGLTGVKVQTEQDLEIEKPVVMLNRSQEDLRRHSLPSIEASGYAQSSTTLPVLTVTHADQLQSPDVWGKRYRVIMVDGVTAQVPNGATLVANEITAIHGGQLTGNEFSLVARRMSNLAFDVSGSRKPDVAAGTVRLYVKLIENVHVAANGAQGADGQAGKPGNNGLDGAKGRDADCGGFGAYHGANGGGSGGDAGNGSDGQPGENGQKGGLVVVTTIVNPVSSIFDISGGKPGQGGSGGAAGTPGAAGRGGLGCVGIGGNAQTEKDGNPGRPGQPGASGHSGTPGQPGEYRLQIVKSFDPIIEKLRTLSNAQLDNALKQL